MADTPTRKEMSRQYQEREIVGGVYAIRNTQNGKMLIEAAADLRGSQNRFAFAQSTGSCVSMKLQSDWNAQDGKAFVFEPLEELKKGENQTMAQFKEDLETLKEFWLEKLAEQELY